MKKVPCIFSCMLCIAFVMAFCVSALAAVPTNLTWDGTPMTLTELAKSCGQDVADENGNYKPLYYKNAFELWEYGLFLGSDGSFDLDNQLTRAEGVVMVIRILGKEAEAGATTFATNFTDVPEWAKSYVAYAVQNGIVNGYNATTFGSSDPMTAAQFITLALRAMGYKDGEDFTWNTSYDKALEIGLIGSSCHAQYSRSNLFVRDDAAVIAYNAVFTAPTNAGGRLADTLALSDKQSGTVPTAIRTGNEQAAANSLISVDRISNLKRCLENVMNTLNMHSGEGKLLFAMQGGGSTAFEDSQPRITSLRYDIQEQELPKAEDLAGYYYKIREGIYDYAGDPCLVGIYYMDNSNQALISLNHFRAATNNSAVTQEIFNEIRAKFDNSQGVNAAILYDKNADGEAYGCAIVLNISGYSRDGGKTYTYFSLDPEDSAFGQATEVPLLTVGNR